MSGMFSVKIDYIEFCQFCLVQSNIRTARLRNCSCLTSFLRSCEVRKPGKWCWNYKVVSMTFQLVWQFVVGYYANSYAYDWKRDEAEKNLLRTHTTAVSSRMLYKLAQVFLVLSDTALDAFSFSSPKQTHKVIVPLEFCSDVLISFRFISFEVSKFLFKHGGIFRMVLHQRGTFLSIGCSGTRLWIAHILPSFTRLKVLLLLCCFVVSTDLNFVARGNVWHCLTIQGIYSAMTMWQTVMAGKDICEWPVFSRVCYVFNVEPSFSDHSPIMFYVAWGRWVGLVIRKLSKQIVYSRDLN